MDDELPEIFSLCENTDNETIECLLHLPRLQEMHNPITMTNIHQHQSTDQSLQLKQQTNPIEFPIKTISNMSIICHIKDQQQPSQWKIVLPTNLLRPVIHWYHLTLQHAGAD